MAYRPWWFPERNPQEQALFDKIIAKVQSVFEQHNYQHIWTPAVESIDILKKGWDVVEQQVFWLYWLAQWVEDTKDYALHFDLTVPLARYVLDHRNDIVFPFSRYQMQPVWRGERTKRWRYKEFWQMDIDTIWPSNTDVGVWYDVQSIYVMDKVMDTLTIEFGVHIDKIAKISHLWLTKKFLAHLWLDAEQIVTTCKILDAYYKKPHEETVQLLTNNIGSAATEKLVEVILQKDRHLLATIEWYEQFNQICEQLDILGVNYEYDICIVRGHNYYSGMVIEWLEKNDIALWSLAAWGRYDNLTDFIDPKQSFSGVWTSLGRFVYLLMEKINNIASTESYLFINFDDTKKDIIWLYQKFLAAWKKCEIYPTPAKLWKQFEYADRKWIQYCVLLWSGEKEKNIYTVKNLKTGESVSWWFDYSYGIIPVCVGGEWVHQVLLAQHAWGHRWFPKWHAEAWESVEQTALRECLEETWISNIDTSRHINNSVKEIYIINKEHAHWYCNEEIVLKTVEYFIWFIDTDTVKIDNDEIKNYWWFPLEEAYKKATYPMTQNIILQIKNIL